MSRLHIFGSVVRGGGAYVVLDQSGGLLVNGEILRSVSIELRSVAEIDGYKPLLVADLVAALGELRAKFIEQAKIKRDPFA